MNYFPNRITLTVTHNTSFYFQLIYTILMSIPPTLINFFSGKYLIDNEVFLMHFKSHTKYQLLMKSFHNRICRDTLRSMLGLFLKYRSLFLQRYSYHRLIFHKFYSDLIKPSTN